jgi:hypothetical protein
MASQERAQRESEALAHPEDDLIWQTPAHANAGSKTGGAE